MALRRQSRRLDSSAAGSESLSNGLYQPYLPRKKKRGDANLPKDVFTCWAVCCDSWESDSWVPRVTACSHCLQYRRFKPLKKNLRTSTQGTSAREFQCQTLWTQILPPGTTAKVASPFKQRISLQKNAVVTVTPKPKKRKRPTGRTPDVPDMSTNNVSSPQLLTAAPPNVDASASVAISLQKDIYASYKKASPRILLSSPASTSAYETEISSLKTALFDVRHSRTKLEGKCSRLQFSYRRLQESNSELKESYTELKESNLLLSTKLATAERSIYDLKMEMNVPETTDGIFATYIQKVKERFPKGTWQSTIYREIVDELWSYLEDDDTCRPYILQKCRETLLPFNPFLNPVELAKLMDLNGAVLNLGGLHLLRAVKVEVGQTEEGGSTWITSSYQIKKAMAHLEMKADVVLPFRQLDDFSVSEADWHYWDPQAATRYESDELGTIYDGFEFDFLKKILFILRLYKLDTIALDDTQAAVNIAITLDGADLSRNYTHVTCGIKIVDPRAIDPRTGLPIGVDGSTAIQSRHHCHAFKFVLAKDSQQLYDDHFKAFFRFFELLEKGTVVGADFAPGRIYVSSPQDVSSFWKTLKRGGACKRDREFCGWCACLSNQCHLPRVRKCQKCISLGKRHCYHWEVGDVPTLERMKDDFDTIGSSFPFLQDKGGPGPLLAKLLLHARESQADKTVDASHIDFDAITKEQKKQFSSDLNTDLGLLKLSRIGNLDVRRERLRHALGTLGNLEEIQQQIDASQYAGAWILIRQAIPCILHCENRCGEKILKMLLLEGWDERDQDNSARDKMLIDVVKVVNTRILGKPKRPANWRIITAKDSENRTTLGDQSMPNRHVRKFIEQIDLITEVVILDEERRQSWNQVIGLWSNLMTKARQREDFTDGDIELFEDMCDEFYENWISLNGQKGITNYFHMVGAGHLTYYLRHYRNLYRFSQQGWEALNAMLKQVFFRRTQRGGNGGKKDEINSKSKPIGRWLQRRMMFLSGQYKKYFGEDGKPKN
jgi:hypothetical protein